MQHSLEDTIFAPATPIGGAIAIIRISGSGAKAALSACFTGRIAHRGIYPGLVMSGEEAVDEGMAAYFKAPHSYTGEDMAELYIHGGAATAGRTLQALSQLGLREARPGEFTQRAFLNGKMDLSRAEAVMDVINAGSERARSSAFEQLRGALSRRIEGIQQRVMDMLAGIDAAIDYPEEMDEDVTSRLGAEIESVMLELTQLIEGGIAARPVREGLRVTIAGKPNAGKSTLFNHLLGEERAIVTDAPGTTRDVIEGCVIMGGVPVRLFDTAGIRAADERAESIGVERARARAGDCDLLLVILDATRAPDAEDEALLRLPVNRLAVVTKLDAGEGAAAFELARRCGVNAAGVSAVSGGGMEELRRLIALPFREGGGDLLTNSRHISALERARESLAAALSGVDEPDCAATDIGMALRELGSITGSDVDAGVIDRIFERFCVGK